MIRPLICLSLFLAAPAFAASAEAGLKDPYEVRLTPTNEVPLPGDDFYPEGIAVSAEGDLYVGSLSKNEIWRLDRQTKRIERFSAPDANLRSIIGVHVSGDGRSLHACSSDPKGAYPDRRSELVTFDLQSGAVTGRAQLPRGGLCNDIAELADGTILLTDSFGGRIFALRPGSRELSVWAMSPDFAGEGFNLNGITSVVDAVFAVKYNSGELFKFTWDLNGVKHERLSLDRPLNGPDGLERLGPDTLLVVEGFTGSVSIIDLSTGSLSVVAQDLDSPTTAAIFDGFAYVVQGQLDHFFGMTQEPPGPFSLKRVTLP